jgi:phage terminase large subunit
MGKLDKKYNIIKFINGSEILLLDCAAQPSDPLYTRFGSLELTGGFVDEANEVDEQAITILRTRIGRQKNMNYKIIPKLLCTFNPDQGWIKRTFWTPYKEGQLPLFRKFIPSLVTDNKYVDPNYIEQLRESDEVTKQRLLYGNFDWSSDAGKVFRYDEIYDLFRTNIEKNDVMYMTCDVARLGDDKTVIMLWRGMECFKIITYKENTIDQLAQRLKELEQEYQIHRNHICIDSD